MSAKTCQYDWCHKCNATGYTFYKLDYFRNPLVQVCPICNGEKVECIYCDW